MRLLHVYQAADRRSVGLRPTTEISYRDMRKLTEKLYSRLPEVREKKEQVVIT